MKLRDFGVLLTLAALWGGSFLFIRVASPALGPVTLAAARVSLAGVALLVFAAALRQGAELRRRWLRFIILGVFNAALPYTLIAYAELRLSAGLGAILNATTPLFTAVVAAVWLKDALTPLKVVGVLMGVVGVGVLVGGGAVSVDTPTLIAVGAILAGSFCYAIASVYARRALADAKPLAAAMGQQLGAAVVLLPFAIPIVTADPSSVHLSGEAVGATVALALVCTAVAYLLYFHLITHVGPTATVSVTLLVPIFALVWSAIFLHESATPSSFVGLAIILASVLLIVGVRLPRRAAPQPTTTQGAEPTQLGTKPVVESASLVD